jgi:hypothetical protein
VPPLIFRMTTTGRSARSAALLSGTTPAAYKNGEYWPWWRSRRLARAWHSQYTVNTP